MSGKSTNELEEPVRKKPRGPYKLWENQRVGVAPPRSTAIYREQRRQALEGHASSSTEPQTPTHIEPARNSNQAEIAQETEQGIADQEAQAFDIPICLGVCTCGKCPPPINVTAETEKPKKKDRHNWDEPLTAFTKTTKFKAFLGVLHLGLRHGITGPLVEDLLKFVNFLFGEKVIPTTEYIFKKLFSPKCAVQFHIYCSSCELYFGIREELESSFKCSNCGTECHPKYVKDNFFLTVSLKEQLEYLLKQSDATFVSQDRKEGMYCDIVDGELYRNLRQPGNVMEDPNSLSVTFNVDGAQVFRSAKGSLWPLQCFVNEFSPDIRYRSDNVMCGLWFGKGSRNMSTFLHPFTHELEGLVVSRPGNAENTIDCPVFGLICSVDSIAKPKLQSIKQHNGSFGCGYCLHPNLPVERLPSNQLKYVAVDEDGLELRYPNRNHESILDDMLKAYDLDDAGLLIRSNVSTPKEQTLDHVNGLTGLSVLASVTGFDLVYGFSIDYLHQLLKGVTDTVVDLLCAGPMKSRLYWKDKNYDVRKLDARLKAINPPQDMSTRSKAVSARTEWKAKDSRSFLLFYALPCMQDLLDTPYFSNLAKLVIGSYILLSDEISSEQLEYADKLLQELVNEFNTLYESCNMTYNIHLSTHLAEMVKKIGPLCFVSTFVFESGNGRLTRLVTGTRGVVTQIFRKYLTVQCVPDLAESHSISQEAFEFCSDVIGFEYVKKSAKFIDTRVFGDANVRETDDELRQVLEENNIEWGLDVHTYYNRAVRDGVVYCCKAYTRPEVFDNTCVILVDNTFAVIEKFMKIPGRDPLMVLLRPIRKAESGHLAPHIHACARDMFAPFKLLPMAQVKGKCVRVQVDNVNGEIAIYICTFPNNYEKD